jgi:hypothetical protein
VRRAGGRIGDKGEFKNTADVLVRGASSKWKYGTYGKKEERAAECVRKGSRLSVILVDDFLPLIRRGKPAPLYGLLAGEPIESLQAVALVEGVQRATDPGSLLTDKGLTGRLDRLGISRGRREQALLRAIHIGRAKAVRCSMCGRTLPPTLIVAAHIKPRSRCTMQEKRDLRNVAMPMCLLGCDALFEKGAITVSPEGTIAVSRFFARTPGVLKVLSRLRGRRCAGHSPLSEQYFEWHRTKVFL